MFRYLAIFAVFALSGCATTAGYEKVLNSWVGAQEIDLVRSWGPPVQVYEAGGRKFTVYSAKRNVYLPKCVFKEFSCLGDLRRRNFHQLVAEL